MNAVPFWIEATVAALLAMSGVLVVISSVGFLRLPDFFQRMHPPALAYTLGSWCVTLGAVLYVSSSQSRFALHPWIIIVLLARVALFRARVAKIDCTPPPLRAPAAPGAGVVDSSQLPLR